MSVAQAPTISETERDTEFRWLPIEQLFVADYGRPASNVKIKKLVRDWDSEGIGMLMVSIRPDGRCAIIDGQHRWLAAKIKGERFVPARVYRDMQYEREAELYGLFATVNKQGPSDRLRARIEAREPVALALKATIEKHGLTVGFGGSSKDGRLTAIDAADKMAQVIGMDGLDRELGILTDIWGIDPAALSSTMLFGMAIFLRRYENIPEFSRAHLISSLRNHTARKLMAQAREMKDILTTAVTGVSGGSIGFTLLAAYNKGLRNKLPSWSETDYRKHN